MLSRYFLDFSVSVGAFVIGMSQIPSFILSLFQQFSIEIIHIKFPSLGERLPLLDLISLLSIQPPSLFLSSSPNYQITHKKI